MLYEDNYLVHYGIKGQRWGVRRFQDEYGRLTEAGKKRYSENSAESSKSQNEAAESIDRKKQDKKKLLEEGEKQAIDDFKKMESMKDHNKKSDALISLLEKANAALGPYADSTYPGFDEKGDAKQQQYNIRLCYELDRKVKGICDPLALLGKGSDGHTPGTKAITDKMKQNIEQQDEIYRDTFLELQAKKKTKIKDMLKMSSKDFYRKLNALSESRSASLIKEYEKLEGHDLREQIVKDLGLPVNSKTLSLVYPFIYNDPYSGGILLKTDL